MMTFVSWYFILNNREHLLLFTWTGLLLSHDWRSKIRTGDLLSPLTSVMNSLDRDLPRVLTNVRCRQFVAFLVSCLLVPSTWLWRHAVHRLSSLTAWPKYCNFVFMATHRLRLVVTFFERCVKKFLLSLFTYLLTYLLIRQIQTSATDWNFKNSRCWDSMLVRLLATVTWRLRWSSASVHNQLITCSHSNTYQHTSVTIRLLNYRVKISRKNWIGRCL